MTPGSTGVTAVAVPTSDSFAQLKRVVLRTVFARHAFCSVVRREGSCLGSVTNTDLMFAWPAGCVIVVTRLAPLAFDGLPLVEAVNVGLNASPAQPSAWNGLDIEACLCLPPKVERRMFPWTSFEQLVGLRRKPCLLTSR